MNSRVAGSVVGLPCFSSFVQSYSSVHCAIITAPALLLIRSFAAPRATTLEQQVKDKIAIVHIVCQQIGTRGMSEYQSFLGSAAAGAADAMVEAGGHAPAKAKRRAASERRADRRNRSRSPDRDGAPDVRAEVAERAIEAPTYV